MEQRISFVTLAVRDLDRTRAFYLDGLGWTAALDVPGEVLMIRAGQHLVLSLWDAARFEDEVGPITGGAGVAPLTLAHNVPTRAEVDQVLDTARAAGADPVHAGEERDWGGYTGYFGDPDGFRWEVAWNPGPIGAAVLPTGSGPEPAAVNRHGQPVGPPLPDWTPCGFPDIGVLEGRWCRIEPLRPDHAAELYDVLGGPGNDALWTYASAGPFTDPADFAQFVEERAADTGRVAVAVRTPDAGACGIADLLRIDQENGSVEVGGIVYGPALQRTTAATEAIYLLARHVFALGYRRLEWKCDALNEPSRRAAARLGFRYDGRFRQAVVYKGRSRDTDWFSITADEWPARAAELGDWLDPANHTDDGRQIRSLADFRS